jgi:hypothetical protein
MRPPGRRLASFAAFLAMNAAVASLIAGSQNANRADLAQSGGLVRDDWPGWRGRNGLGVRTDPLPLSKWDANYGILWMAPVPGQGHSSPIVVADQVFLTSADEGEQTLFLLVYERKTPG